MEHPTKSNIPYEEIDNGALVLLLLRDYDTWEKLRDRYANTRGGKLVHNTCAMTLRDKLFKMRELGLLAFEEEEVDGEKQPLGQIRETGLWTRIRNAFGGMSLEEAAMISRHSKGMAVAPVFGRPKTGEEKTDIFVLMPFKTELQAVYTDLVTLGDELGLVVRRADHDYDPGVFMDKVWSRICNARLVIADCTERNPNVFYEIGIAHTLGKQVVLLTRSEEDVPSDIKHFNYLPYIYDDAAGAQAFAAKLRTFIIKHFNLKAADAGG